VAHEESQTTPKASDGWLSRNTLIPLCFAGVAELIATAAMYTDIATFDQWADFSQWAMVALFGAVGLGTNATKAIAALASARKADK